MLDQLTNYLFQYRRVSIPSVGTILLVQQPSELNVADKTILPPSFTAHLKEGDDVPGHQLQFLAGSLMEEEETVLSSLQDLGRRLNEKINGEGFNWRGIGLIQKTDEPFVVSLQALQPVPAERVLRQNAEHNVLVGDQQMTSTQITGRREEEAGREEKESYSIFMIIGWIVLFLSILYIVFVLYQGKFRVGASGSRSAPTSYFDPAPEQETSVFTAMHREKNRGV